METDATTELETGERVFDALRGPMRRRILLEVKRRIDAGARELTYTDRPDFTGSETRVRLVHADLPKLECYGFVAWDRDSDTLRPGENWGDIEPVLDVLIGARDRLPFELGGADGFGFEGTGCPSSG